MNNIVLLIVPENKPSVGCGLGQQFAFIKNRVKI
jgi:hypothetical protein